MTKMTKWTKMEKNWKKRKEGEKWQKLKQNYPAAQLPLALPPLFWHSLLVKHVPFLAASCEAHPSFGKVTIENRENTEIYKLNFNRYIYIIMYSCLIHLLVQEKFGCFQIFLTAFNIFWMMSNFFQHAQICKFAR